MRLLAAASFVAEAFLPAAHPSMRVGGTRPADRSAELVTVAARPVLFGHAAKGPDAAAPFSPRALRNPAIGAESSEGEASPTSPTLSGTWPLPLPVLPAVEIAVGALAYGATRARLDRWDKKVSEPIFGLRMPMAAELALSVPGAWFSMPLFFLVSPLLLTGHPLAFLLAAAMFLGWVRIQGADERVFRSLYSKRLYMFCPLCGPLFCSLAGVPVARALLHVQTWFLALIPIMAVKKLTKRRRPIISDCGRPKGLPSLEPIIIRDGLASFPSGDVMSAVCFAFPLRDAHPWLSAGMVALTAFGRIYFRAHHLFDVVCGAVLAYTICAGVVASGMYGSWWHPLFAQAAFLCWAKTVGALGDKPLEYSEQSSEDR